MSCRPWLVCKAATSFLVRSGCVEVRGAAFCKMESRTFNAVCLLVCTSNDGQARAKHRYRHAAQKGRRASDLASQFNLSRGRVRQIAVSREPVERRRSQLEKKYGSHPRVDKLPDDTPVNVPILCEANIQHWEARVRQLHRASTPIRTLGDLRSTTSARLLREPHIGAMMVAELRAHSPFRRGRKRT